MKTLLLPALGLLALSAVAPAQSTNVDERRGFVTVGIYIPQSIDGVDLDPGAVLSIGGNIVTRENFRVGLELRGSAVKFNDDVLVGDGTLSINSIFVNFSSRPVSGRGLFYGGALGFAKASISDGDISISDDDTEFSYAAFVGFDLSRTTFAQARYQGAGQDGYRGFSVEFGYRF